MKALLIHFIFMTFVTSVYADEACAPLTSSDEQGVVIGWLTETRTTTSLNSGVTTVVEPFRPLAILNKTFLVKADDARLHKGQILWPVFKTSKSVNITSASSFMDHMGVDHCVSYAALSDVTLPKWTLLSSRPLPNTFRMPTAQQSSQFYQSNSTCEIQGDYPPEETPMCTRPVLLAVTDLNNDGQSEFWATEPYTWDTGLTVWQSRKGKLEPILQTCPGCSD